jgi:hypothetical protein
MLEVYLLGGLLLLVVAGIPLYFVGAAMQQREQDKDNANKKKVYVSTLILTYCGVGTALMNKKRLYYKNYNEEEAGASYKKLKIIGEQTYQKLDTISDTDIFNFADVLVIHKNQFIAIEIGMHEEYE